MLFFLSSEVEHSLQHIQTFSITEYTTGFKSMVSCITWEWLEMEILGPYPRHTESKTDSGAHQSVSKLFR